MTRDEVPVLTAQLNALCEVYDKRHMTPQAVQVWVDTVKEFKTPRVMALLIEWPKINGKMPTPGDLWKRLNEVTIDEREAQQQNERARHERDAERILTNLQGRVITARILTWLGTQKRDGKAWAKKILADHAANPASVNWIQLEYAREAIGLDVRTGLAKNVVREPGADYEEDEFSEATA